MKKKWTKTSSGRVETLEMHRRGLKSLWVGQRCILNLECETNAFGLKDLNYDVSESCDVSDTYMYWWRYDLRCIWSTALGHRPAPRLISCSESQRRGGGKEWYACLQDIAGAALWWAPRYDFVILSSLCQLGWVTPQIRQFTSALRLPSNFHCSKTIFTKNAPHFTLCC